MSFLDSCDDIPESFPGARKTTLASAPSFAQVGDGILCHGHSERFMGSIHVAWLPLTNGLKFVDWWAYAQ